MTTFLLHRTSYGPRWLVLPGLLLYFAIMGALPIIAGGTDLCRNDFGMFFLPGARYVASGQTLDMYAIRVGVYPNATGPVGNIVQGAVLWVGRLFQLQTVGPQCRYSDPYPLPGDAVGLRIWFALVFAALVVYTGVRALGVIDRLRGTSLIGWQRFVAIGLIAASIPMGDSIIFYGHYELPLAILFALIGVECYQRDRFGWSGVWFALALLSRSSLLLLVVPLIVVLLFERAILSLIRFGATLATVTLAGILPFYLHDRTDTVYSLSSFRGLLAIGDGSFWIFFRNTPLEKTVQSLDSVVALLVALFFSAVIVWLGRVRHTSRDLYGLISIASVCFSLCIKTIWSYYFAEPLLWGVIWVVSSREEGQPWWEWIPIPLFFTCMMFLSEVRLGIVGDTTFFTTTMRANLVLILSALTTIMLLAYCTILLIIIVQRSARAQVPIYQPVSVHHQQI